MMKQFLQVAALVASTFFITSASGSHAATSDQIGSGMAHPQKPSFRDFVSEYAEINEFERQLALAVDGDAVAQGKVAFAYSEGVGVQQNFYKAVEWACRAAKQGDFLGMQTVVTAGLASTRVYRDVVTCDGVEIVPRLRPQPRPKDLGGSDG